MMRFGAHIHMMYMLLERFDFQTDEMAGRFGAKFIKFFLGSIYLRAVGTCLVLGCSRNTDYSSLSACRCAEDRDLSWQRGLELKKTLMRSLGERRAILYGGPALPLWDCVVNSRTNKGCRWDSCTSKVIIRKVNNCKNARDLERERDSRHIRGS